MEIFIQIFDKTSTTEKNLTIFLGFGSHEKRNDLLKCSQIPPVGESMQYGGCGCSRSR